jgi:hypothetical protein
VCGRVDRRGGRKRVGGSGGAYRWTTSANVDYRDGETTRDDFSDRADITVYTCSPRELNYFLLSLWPLSSAGLRAWNVRPGKD